MKRIENHFLNIDYGSKAAVLDSIRKHYELAKIRSENAVRGTNAFLFTYIYGVMNIGDIVSVFNKLEKYTKRERPRENGKSCNRVLQTYTETWTTEIKFPVRSSQSQKAIPEFQSARADSTKDKYPKPVLFRNIVYIDI